MLLQWIVGILSFSANHLNSASRPGRIDLFATITKTFHFVRLSLLSLELA